MTWSVTAIGNTDEIGKAFDAERAVCAGWGMIESEQRDMDKARDFAMQFASSYGRVAVRAGGTWNHAYPDASEPAAFGQISLTISAAPVPAAELAPPLIVGY